MSFGDKMAPSVSEWIFRAEHESGLKNFPSRHVFEKIGVAYYGIIWRIIFSKFDRIRLRLVTRGF